MVVVVVMVLAVGFVGGGDEAVVGSVNVDTHVARHVQLVGAAPSNSKPTFQRIICSKLSDHKGTFASVAGS